jgi:SAM-dependent methyltransferase
VREAVVVAHSDDRGEKLAAYVVPQETRRAGLEELSAAHVEQWRVLYEDNYGHATGRAHDLAFDIVGWNSSYTGQPLPAAEMRCWLEDTVARIEALAPQRVLEIGVGTGLVLLRMVHRCTEYHAIDFSHKALEQLRHAVAPEHQARVRLYEKRANELEHLSERSVDTVIINSVVQYFPSCDYLAEVLVNAAAKVQDDGYIFVGDVRSQVLLDAFWSDVELARAAPDTTAEIIRTRRLGRVERESELVVSPLFFEALRARIPRIQHVEIWPKRGAYRNELSLFRYDVVLHLGGTDARRRAQPERVIEWKQELNLAALQAITAAAGTGGCVVRDVANARLTVSLAAQRWLEGQGADPRRQPMSFGIDPEEVWSLADAAHDVRVSWRRGDPMGRFDIVIEHRGHPLEAPGPSTPLPPLERLTNAPLNNQALPRLEHVLRNDLKELLPAYMLPSTFVFLPALPMTHNGKVDRAALPRPNLNIRGNQPASTLLAPRTAAERAIVQIWQQVLGAEELGIRDKFFDVGGDSLSMVRVYSLLEEKFPGRVQVADLYDNPTVESMARLLTVAEECDAEHDITIL